MKRRVNPNPVVVIDNLYIYEGLDSTCPTSGWEVVGWIVAGLIGGVIAWAFMSAVMLL